MGQPHSTARRYRYRVGLIGFNRNTQEVYICVCACVREIWSRNKTIKHFIFFLSFKIQPHTVPLSGQAEFHKPIKSMEELDKYDKLDLGMRWS